MDISAFYTSNVFLSGRGRFENLDRFCFTVTLSMHNGGGASYKRALFADSTPNLGEVASLEDY